MTMALADKSTTIERTTPAPTMMKNNTARKKPDLTEEEEAVLRALLLDIPQGSSSSSRKTKVFDDKVLFSLPFHQEEPPSSSNKQRNTQLLNLWRAFEDGVKPRTLVRHASNIKERQASKGKRIEKQKSLKEEDNGDESVCSVRSDEEVRVEVDHDDSSSCLSWKEEECGQEHYDSWEVLKDEYAQDFGFDYRDSWSPDLEDVSDDDQGHTFKILGTSADDKASHPHVLSPPLMDAIMYFLPEELENQNFWLKYSLVRDGSSMNTLKHYVRASSNTILAIETTTGQVFGAFTTSPWRTQFGFFGQGDGSFLWRMRHNRKSPCHSLFEQAQLETEIDVYAYSGENKLVQRCSHNEIAIGGGNINEGAAPLDPGDALEEMEDTAGFGIAIDEFLARGTTSPCATFRNPSLMNNLGETETFDIANLEVWSLTPAWDVKQAEKLEMTMYFVNQSSHADSSIHSVAGSHTGSYNGSHTPPRRDSIRASDLTQDKFYRRVGENDASEEQRDRWQRSAMMGFML